MFRSILCSLAALDCGDAVRLFNNNNDNNKMHKHNHNHINIIVNDTLNIYYDIQNIHYNILMTVCVCICIYIYI